MKGTLKSILFVILVLTAVSTVFFIYTSTDSSPTSLELQIPKDKKATDNAENYLAKITLLLLKDDMVYGYFGNDIDNGRSIALKEVRNIVLEGTKKFTRDSLMVIIKPAPQATYKNTVDVLDEMVINDIKRYKMTDLDNNEKEFLAKAR